jgi:predicted nucleotidyltransferase
MEEVRRIVLDGLEGLPARVFLFGSRARGDARASSDIDVAVLPRALLPAVVLARIRERLEESTVPFRVDLVDLTTADEALVKSVMEEGVPWTA